MSGQAAAQVNTREQPAGRAHEPKFNNDAVVAIVAISFLILDIADWASFGIPVTDFLSWGIQFYVWKKGTSGTLQIVVGVFEIIPPPVDLLPFKTVAFLIIVWGDRHPDSWAAKFVKVAEKVSEVKGKLGKGKKGKGKQAGTEETSKERGEIAASSKTSAGKSRGSAKQGTRPGTSGASSTSRSEGAASSGSEKTDTAREGPRVPVQGQIREERPQREKTREESELEDELAGNYVGLAIKNSIGFDKMSQVGKPANDNRESSPVYMGDVTKPAPRPAPRPPSANAKRKAGTKSKKGRYNKDQEVDLRNAA